MKFEIGDKVIMNTQCSYNYLIKEGWTGTVITVMTHEKNVGVQFDNRLSDGHDCGGDGVYKYCYYIKPAEISHYSISSLFKNRLK